MDHRDPQLVVYFICWLVDISNVTYLLWPYIQLQKVHRAFLYGSAAAEQFCQTCRIFEFSANGFVVGLWEMVSPPDALVTQRWNNSHLCLYMIGGRGGAKPDIIESFKVSWFCLSLSAD